jgi:pre-mRNA-processing factor 6
LLPQQNDDAKIILANAAQHVGQSVKIWLAASDLEHDAKAKKRVLRRGTTFSSSPLFFSGSHRDLALEHIPNSVRLWKETVNLETSPADARILLSRAVEVIPLSVELWLALARLETPENAKGVLNKARKAVPTSHEIWIAAGRLIEQEAYATDLSEEKRTEELERVDKTLAMAVRALRAHGVLLTREQWLKEAERCEAEGAPRTCEAIVTATVAMDVEEEDRLATWLGDAEAAEVRGRVGTARAVLAFALRVFPDRRDLWRRAADLEKVHGSRETLDKLLARAVECCPQAEVLWLMWAKEKWLGGDVPAAREVLERAFVSNPESEQIWLAAVKLEAENGELGVARELLVRARTVADTERVTISFPSSLGK